MLEVLFIDYRFRAMSFDLQLQHGFVPYRVSGTFSIAPGVSVAEAFASTHILRRTLI